MLRRPRTLGLVAFAVAALSLGWATGLVSLPWTHDMDRQPSIKPQEMPLLPADGAVAITGHVDDGARDHADQLVNTAAADTTVLRRGKISYDTYCLPCHGPAGQGNGKVAKSLPIPPVDLTRPDLQAGRSDGSIYYTIRHGNVIMPGYAYALTRDRAWEVVRYVRTLRAQ